jgi:pimeloyl-ACP methyl ester carboxylesterase
MELNLKTSKNQNAVLAILLIMALMVTAIPIIIPSTKAANDSAWTLVTDGRGIKSYPDLREYVWQKNASLAPNGAFDKIGLHRLVSASIGPKGVIFINPGAWGSGEQLISTLPESNFTASENSSQPIYWANRGFDVYSIDYRAHFVPANATTNQFSFMLNWGWDQWISDTKEAVDKAKQVSGVNKVFMAGISFGGDTTMNYASVYWKQDLRGIILLDPTFNGTQGNPIVTNIGKETNTFNLTKSLAGVNLAGAWSFEAYSSWGVIPSGAVFIEKYALENPNAPAEYPPGTPLQPTINPMTNQTWANISEWNAYTLYYVFKGQAGAYANNFGGYSNTTLVAQKMSSSDRFWPTRLLIEGYAFRDWINCPYVTYDFDDHYKEINVPLLAFASELYQNRTGTLRFVNGINNTDFTGIYLPKYSHSDVFLGTNSARDVTDPTLQWMVNHYSILNASVTPVNTSATVGSTATFTVTVSGGVAPYAFQWYQGPNLLIGKTTTQLQLLIDQQNAGGTFPYYCKITDSEGTTINSNTITLTVTYPTQPISTTSPSPSVSPSLSPTSSPSPSPSSSPSPTPAQTPNSSALTLSPESTIAIAIAVIIIVIAAIAIALRRK